VDRFDDPDYWKAVALGNYPGLRDKEEYIHDLFEEIAGKYDRLNHILSFGLDRLWRQRAARACELGPGDRAIDVATGTGDLAFALADYVGTEGEVTGVDLSEGMLYHARRKACAAGLSSCVRFLVGNALDLPFPDNSFNVATCGFALRNVSDITGAICEMVRVVVPGGRIVILELSQPVFPLFACLYSYHLHRVLPVLSHIFGGRRGPYTYLPYSLDRFPSPEKLTVMMEKAGCVDAVISRQLGGIAVIINAKVGGGSG